MADKKYKDAVEVKADYAAKFPKEVYPGEDEARIALDYPDGKVGVYKVVYQFETPAVPATDKTPATPRSATSEESVFIAATKSDAGAFLDALTAHGLVKDGNFVVISVTNVGSRALIA